MTNGAGGSSIENADLMSLSGASLVELAKNYEHETNEMVAKKNRLVAELAEADAEYDAAQDELLQLTHCNQQRMQALMGVARGRSKAQQPMHELKGALRSIDDACHFIEEGQKDMRETIAFVTTSIDENTRRMREVYEQKRSGQQQMEDRRKQVNNQLLHLQAGMLALGRFEEEKVLGREQLELEELTEQKLETDEQMENIRQQTEYVKANIQQAERQLESLTAEKAQRDIETQQVLDECLQMEQEMARCAVEEVKVQEETAVLLSELRQLEAQEAQLAVKRCETTEQERKLEQINDQLQNRQIKLDNKREQIDQATKELEDIQQKIEQKEKSTRVDCETRFAAEEAKLSEVMGQLSACKDDCEQLEKQIWPEDEFDNTRRLLMEKEKQRDEYREQLLAGMVELEKLEKECGEMENEANSGPTEEAATVTGLSSNDNSAANCSLGAVRRLHLSQQTLEEDKSIGCQGDAEQQMCQAMQISPKSFAIADSSQELMGFSLENSPLAIPPSKKKTRVTFGFPEDDVVKMPMDPPPAPTVMKAKRLLAGKQLAQQQQQLMVTEQDTQYRRQKQQQQKQHQQQLQAQLEQQQLQEQLHELEHQQQRLRHMQQQQQKQHEMQEQQQMQQHLKEQQQKQKQLQEQQQLKEQQHLKEQQQKQLQEQQQKQQQLQEQQQKQQLKEQQQKQQHLEEQQQKQQRLKEQQLHEQQQKQQQQQQLKEQQQKQLHLKEQLQKQQQQQQLQEQQLKQQQLQEHLQKQRQLQERQQKQKQQLMREKQQKQELKERQLQEEQLKLQRRQQQQVKFNPGTSTQPVQHHKQQLFVQSPSQGASGFGTQRIPIYKTIGRKPVTEPAPVRKEPRESSLKNGRPLKSFNKKKAGKVGANEPSLDDSTWSDLEVEEQE